MSHAPIAEPPDVAGPVADAQPRPTAPVTPRSGSQPLRWADPPTPPREPRARRLGRLAAAALCLAVVAVGGLVIWDHYVTAPWTRDGRVRVQVANVVPQVAGQIVELRVVDDQFVHKGDVLYVVDPFNYRVALAGAKATVRQDAADFAVKSEQAKRLLALDTLATTAQQQQQASGAADAAEGALQYAQQQQALAEINLQRTQVTSPVNGFVNNLLLRVGDWAEAGQTNVSVIDTDSFWIDGYFEETKLGRICVGDAAEAQLMGFGAPIRGRVATVGRGISVSNATPSTQGLPSVDAVYTWVRLAQRVPVRVRITDVPAGVPLISGLTATVTVRGDAAQAVGPLGAFGASLRSIFAPTAPSPGCIPPDAGGSGPVARIPEPRSAPEQSPQQIVPGLTPGMSERPNQP